MAGKTAFQWRARDMVPIDRIPTVAISCAIPLLRLISDSFLHLHEKAVTLRHTLRPPRCLAGIDGRPHNLAGICACDRSAWANLLFQKSVR